MTLLCVYMLHDIRRITFLRPVCHADQSIFRESSRGAFLKRQPRERLPNVPSRQASVARIGRSRRLMGLPPFKCGYKNSGTSVCAHPACCAACTYDSTSNRPCAERAPGTTGTLREQRKMKHDARLLAGDFLVDDWIIRLKVCLVNPFFRIFKKFFPEGMRHDTG